jgi:HD-GYP domain-containing protein (c-di-GMP phosphodiesterase class II)
MYINFSGLLYAVSYALDCVEGELTGVSAGHSKRVACCCAAMGNKMGMTPEDLMDLSAYACLHDNALTQYISEELRAYHSQDVTSLRSHCLIGERNISRFPFNNKVCNVIMYHHETADGKGPFGQTASETPLFAQLVHIADMVDVQYNLGDPTNDKYENVKEFLSDTSGTVFSQECVDIFLDTFSEEELRNLKTEYAEEKLKQLVPDGMMDYTYQQIVDVVDIFARIIDYKSEFTRQHSLGVARRAFAMACHYGYSEEECYRLYIAGALHDIGKMAINNDVLEKPAQLTQREYIYMQTHAYYTWQIMSQIKGFDDITRWASFHHEKLDGSGYPFSLTGDKLDHNCRLMACIDIYQALSEDRPYKKSMDHDKSIMIMRQMADEGKLDGDIVGELDKVMNDFKCDDTVFADNRAAAAGKG